MEVKQHVLFHIPFVVVIQLILFAGLGSLTQVWSASIEGGTSNWDSDFSNQSTGSFPCIHKYVAGTYFEKHDCLIDSDFQDFIANELPLGSCGILEDKLDAVVKLSALERYLRGEGSHRLLSSSIRLDIQLAKQLEYFSEIIVVERLPSGVFADPFELQHLLYRGEFEDVAVFGDLNLELPSVASNRSLVEVHIDIDHNVLSRDNNELEVNVDLPLHVRYPPLEERGFSRIEFSKPDVFIRAIAEGESHNHSCLFMLTSSKPEFKVHVVAWEVPSGIKEHTSFVSVVTFVAAVISAFIIVLTSIYY